MEWAVGVFLAVMLGLYIWSHVTAGHAIGKKVQPFIDDLFGVGPKTGQNPRDEDHREARQSKSSTSEMAFHEKAGRSQVNSLCFF